MPYLSRHGNGTVTENRFPAGASVANTQCISRARNSQLQCGDLRCGREQTRHTLAHAEIGLSKPPVRRTPENQEPRTKNQEPRTKNQEPRTKSAPNKAPQASLLPRTSTQIAQLLHAACFSKSINAGTASRKDRPEESLHTRKTFQSISPQVRTAAQTIQQTGDFRRDPRSPYPVETIDCSSPADLDTMPNSNRTKSPHAGLPPTDR